MRLDFVRLTARAPHRAHVQRTKRNRIDRRSFFFFSAGRNIGTELYNHSASGECYSCLENENVAALPGNVHLASFLSARLRAAWAYTQP